jgi:universal stress protein E
MKEVNEMKRFKDILCVVESGEDCKVALTRAVALADNNQASLTVIGVLAQVKSGIRLSKGSSFLANLQAEMVNGRIRELEMLIEPYRKQINIEFRVLVGTPFLMIIREILRNEHDLLIKTPEPQERFARFFGSDDMHLLRKCPCPVWLIKQDVPKSYGRILAAVDVDEMPSSVEQDIQQSINQHILQIAGSLALSECAELHVVNVWDAMGESTLRHSAFSRTPEDEINAYVEQTRQKHADNLNALLHEHKNDILDYLAPQTHLMKGLARKEIPALAKRIEADMLVMGTVARIGIPGFIMGNTAEAILNQLDCSVLAIKPPGFITPIELED